MRPETKPPPAAIPGAAHENSPLGGGPGNTVVPIDRQAQGYAGQLDDRAQRIRDLVGMARGCIIEIGRELIAAKAEAGHGHWLPWLEREFGWTEDTAQRYMRVAQAFQIPHGAVFDGLSLNASALYTLSAPNVPQEVRDEAIARAGAGERITKQQADEMVARATTDAVARALESERAATASQLAGKEQQIAALRKEIEAKIDSTDATMAGAAETLRELEAAHDLAVQERDALRTLLTTPTDEQVVRLIATVSKKKQPSKLALTALATALGRPISYRGKEYAPVFVDGKATTVHEKNAVQWHRVLMTLRAITELPPVELLFTASHRGFDHALAEVMPQAEAWIAEFFSRMDHTKKKEGRHDKTK